MALFIDKFLKTGLKNTVALKNDTQLSRNGPWQAIPRETEIDRFFLGDFNSAEYCISIDYDTEHKEIIKVLVVASIQKASITVYGRANLGQNLVDIAANITDSYVSIIATPTTGFTNSKLQYNAFYFQNQNLLLQL